MKKKIINIVISILIVLLLNNIIIVAVAFSTEKADTYAVRLGTISDVIFQDNTIVTEKDYSLLNWGYGDVKPAADKAFEILAKSEYERVYFTEQVIIQLLQNRFNSVVMLFQNSNPTYVSEDMDSWARFELGQGTAFRVFVVKLFGDYYVIADYKEKGSITENNKAGDNTTAVYKANSPKNIAEIESLKTEKTHYGSYSFYPIELAQYVATPFSKIINILGLVLETRVFYILLSKKKKLKQ